MEVPRGSLCAACGQPGHRFGRNEGIERFNPQACINGLLARLEVPRGFTRCDECEGGGWEPLPPFDGTIERISKPCLSCSGSGLLPTEKLREEATAAALTMWGRSFADTADAVLAKVAEHLGDRE